MFKRATSPTAHEPSADLPWHHLDAWFQEAPGSDLVQQEAAIVRNFLQDLFGYYLVQVGTHVPADLLGENRISYRSLFEIGSERRDGPDTAASEKASGLTACAALPFGQSTVDVVVLPHVLEFAEHPHAVLREVERILIGEGHVIITGFNPISFAGCWRTALRWRDSVPWSGHYLSELRIRDWLKLLGMEVVFSKSFGFRPPLRSRAMLQRLQFLERVGGVCWPPLGNMYVLAGRKRVSGVTPLKAPWRRSPRLLPGRIAEPSAMVERAMADSTVVELHGRRSTD